MYFYKKSILLQKTSAAAYPTLQATLPNSIELLTDNHTMEFTELIQQRYSCKKYDSTRQLSTEQLNAILESGRLAPTAKNLQEQHIYVVQSPEGLAKIDRHTPCRYGAPTVLVVAYDKDNVYTYPTSKGPDTDHRKSGTEDAAIVATHMLLGARNVGVDSCWLNCVCIDDLHAELGLPDNEEILMLMDLGFATSDAKPLPNHFSRKPLTETVSYI